MASIDKRPSGVWRVRWREYPGGPQKTKSFRRKVDADEWRTSVEHQLRAGAYVDPAAGKVLLSDWWTRWYDTRSDLRASTEARNDVYWRIHIEPVLGSVPLAAIDRPMLRSWVAGMVAGGMAPRSVRKAVQLVRQALQVAVEDRVITSNPADRLRGLPKVATSEARFCTPAELGRLVGAVDERYRVMVLAAGWSGLRLGELCGLRAQSVDIAGRRLEVVETIGEVKGQIVHQAYGKTGAARRIVPLPAHVVDELGSHVEHLDGGDLVFTAPEGGPIRRSLFHARIWQPATVAAGLGKRVPAPTPARKNRTLYEGLRIHDLRHTAVSLWIQAGADLTQLKRWAGHESVATLIDTYGHLMPDREQPVLDALDRLAGVAGGSNVVPITAAGSAG